MFTRNLTKDAGRVDFRDCPDLINRQFKYRSLGEIVAMSRVTNEKPLPTRNGVYIGSLDVPRDTFDRIDAREASMKAYDKAEFDLKDAKVKEAQEKASAERAQFEAEIRQKYQQNPNQ